MAGFLLAIVVAQLVGKAAAATYVVGDTLGWAVPSGGPATYATWASQHVFRVGDVLVFNFATGLHDVARLNKGAFDSCSSTNPIALATVGPASFTLNSTGSDYYICTFGQHCSLGQKLAINVTATPTLPPAPSPPLITPTPTPSPAPSPPLITPTPTPTPTHTPTPTPTPTPGSAPSPAPRGTATPPSSPASETSPGLGTPPSSLPNGDLSPPPPPPPSSATIVTISAPFVLFASIALGHMI